MKNIESVLLKTLVVAGFVGITLCGTAQVRADTGVNTGYQDSGQYSGSGSGGYTGSGSSQPDSNYNQPYGEPSTNYNEPSPSYNQPGSNYNSNYNDQSGYSGSSSGTGTGGSTSSGSEILQSDKSFQRGRTEGGVTYPDFSDTLGPSGSGYFERNGTTSK